MLETDIYLLVLRLLPYMALPTYNLDSESQSPVGKFGIHSEGKHFIKFIRGSSG